MKRIFFLLLVLTITYTFCGCDIGVDVSKKSEHSGTTNSVEEEKEQATEQGAVEETEKEVETNLLQDIH